MILSLPLFFLTLWLLYTLGQQLALGARRGYAGYKHLYLMTMLAGCILHVATYIPGHTRLVLPRWHSMFIVPCNLCTWCQCQHVGVEVVAASVSLTIVAILSN